MKPYSFNPEIKMDTGCCPGHDWPVTHRWAGSRSSPQGKKNASKSNKIAKRSRRRFDKQKISQEILDNE